MANFYHINLSVDIENDTFKWYPPICVIAMMERHEELRRVFEDAEIINFHDEKPYVAVWYGGSYINIYGTHDGAGGFEEMTAQGVNPDDVTEETVEEAFDLVKPEPNL